MRTMILIAVALLAFAPAAGAAGGIPFSGTAVGRDTSMSLEGDGST